MLKKLKHIVIKTLWFYINSLNVYQRIYTLGKIKTFSDGCVYILCSVAYGLNIA